MRRRLKGRVTIVMGAGQEIGAVITERGAINPPLTTVSFSEPAVEYRKKIAFQVPLGGFGEPTEISAAELFLASDESSYATGVFLTVDGGCAAEVFIPPP